MDLMKIKGFKVEMTHNIIRPLSSSYGMHDIAKKQDILQGYGIQRLDICLVYEASVSCGGVLSNKYAHASD